MKFVCLTSHNAVCAFTAQVTSLLDLIVRNGHYIESNNNYEQGSRTWMGLEMIAQLRNCGITPDTFNDLKVCVYWCATG